MISNSGKDCLPNNDEVTITHFVLCVVMTTVFSTTNNKTSKISLLQ